MEYTEKDGTLAILRQTKLKNVISLLGISRNI